MVIIKLRKITKKTGETHIFSYLQPSPKNHFIGNIYNNTFDTVHTEIKSKT